MFLLEEVEGKQNIPLISPGRGYPLTVPPKFNPEHSMRVQETFYMSTRLGPGHPDIWSPNILGASAGCFRMRSPLQSVD